MIPVARHRGGRRGTVHVLSLTFLLAVGGAACGGEDPAPLVTPGSLSPTSASPDVSPPPSAGSPAITIEEPADGSTVPPGELVVRVSTSGVRLVDKIGSPAVQGEGHLLFYLGVDFVPKEPGEPAYTTPGTYAASSSPSFTWPGLSPGRFGVAVQVVNNDDTPLQPAVIARAVITVQGVPAPSGPVRESPRGSTSRPPTDPGAPADPGG